MKKMILVFPTLAAFVSLGVTPNTEWQDVPGTNKVGEVLSAGGAVTTNSVRDIIHATVDGPARPLPKFLHHLRFDDAYKSDAEWWYSLQTNYTAGCSVRRSGDVVERNYDWKFDDMAEFVIEVSAAEGRFASIGVANVGTNLTEEIVTSGKPSRYYKCLPGHTVDGINDRGVVAEVNVVDGDPHTSGWHTDGDIHPLGAVRWALDRGASAAQAANDLAAGIKYPAGFSQNFHYLIADSNETWIVENGTAHRIDTQPVVMTNFNLDRQGGEGYERYDSLTNGASIASQWWTAAYDRSTRPIRITDIGEDYEQVWDAWDSQPREAHRGQRIGGQPWWQTLHTSVYDISSRTLRIAVQENDDWYVFALPSGGKVKSVNGKTGDVLIDAFDIGALPTSGGYLEDCTIGGILEFVPYIGGIHIAHDVAGDEHDETTFYGDRFVRKYSPNTTLKPVETYYISLPEKSGQLAVVGDIPAPYTPDPKELVLTNGSVKTKAGVAVCAADVGAAGTNYVATSISGHNADSSAHASLLAQKRDLTDRQWGQRTYSTPVANIPGVTFEWFGEQDVGLWELNFTYDGESWYSYHSPPSDGWLAVTCSKDAIWSWDTGDPWDPSLGDVVFTRTETTDALALKSELPSAPGNYPAVSNAAMTAVQPAVISDMETQTHADATYQPKGAYLTADDVKRVYNANNTQYIDGNGDVYVGEVNTGGSWRHTNGAAMSYRDNSGSVYSWVTADGRQSVSYNSINGDVAVTGNHYGTIRTGLNPLNGDDLGAVTNGVNIVTFTKQHTQFPETPTDTLARVSVLDGKISTHDASSSAHPDIRATANSALGTATDAKATADGALAALASKANTNDVYTKAYVDSALQGKLANEHYAGGTATWSMSGLQIDGEENPRTRYGCFSNGRSNSFFLSFYGSAFGFNNRVESYCSIAAGRYSFAKHNTTFVWNGGATHNTQGTRYESHGEQTFNINPKGGLSGFYIGDENLATITNDIIRQCGKTEPKRIAMFIIEMNDVPSTGSVGTDWVGFELKASTNNFPERVAPQFYGQSGIVGDSMDETDEMMIYRLYPEDGGTSGRPYTRVRSTSDSHTDGIHPDRYVILVDVSCLTRGHGTDWLSEDNPDLVWCYSRFKRTSEEERASGYRLWHPIAPVRWFSTMPNWAN